MTWYAIENIEEIDSPSVLLYEDRLMYNLQKMLDMVKGDSSRLMPHVKTNKMPEVIRRMVSMGIKNFKASTIAEAEIAAEQGADSVLIAHQLVGPKINRLGNLIKQFPKTSFYTIADNPASLEKLNEEAVDRGIVIGVFIDINNGMNRSGIEPGPGLEKLVALMPHYPSVQFKGFHVYDGHLRDTDFKQRKHKVEDGFKDVYGYFEKLKTNKTDIRLICGGTPSFTSHLTENDRICSPGTCLFWDWGYGEKLQEQEFKHAALLLCRVISKPTAGIVTIDLGHKAVAAENPIDKRVKFLNLDNYKLRSQSEEHGVLEVEDWDSIRVGDVFYGIPYHICPTINLYDEVSVIRDGEKVTDWEVTARRRRIRV
ncbi:D-TA family PLP-dependent enzyme [Leptobacterium flavescens]|uniref:D-TA family PLP-dependent enzyme n=2 Tax=Leptobacterium flavescens TaxID=472055 RepID=A0A6P0UK24_9FLAO|nr:D-TA family PLP-dependent enzyme [Leptobacterium flavescens]